MNDRRLAELEQSLKQVQRDLNRLPLYVPPELPLIRYCKVVLGQTVASVPMIQYAADPLTITTYYDPEIDTAFDAGLGVIDLYNGSGVYVGKVLGRHNDRGFTDPVMAGVGYTVGFPITLTVTLTDAPPGTPVTGKKVTVGSSPSGAFAGHAGETATWDGAAWVFTAAPSSLSMLAYPFIRG